MPTSDEEIQRSEEIRSITARHWEAMQGRDLALAQARHSKMPGISGFGTDPSESYDDARQLTAYHQAEFETMEWWPTGQAEIDAWVEGSVGWSIVRSAVTPPGGDSNPIRVTFIYHLERGDWKIVHQHWSFGVPNERFFGVDLTFDRLAFAAEAEHPDLRSAAAPDGTLTLVFTDIEGSTALNTSFGDRAWLQVLAAHNDVVRRAVRENGGTIVKGQGDGFMLAFPSARRALETAQAIQRGIEETFSDPGSPIRVRIGVHVGEVVREADDFFGHAVNYAARVADAAVGGETLVSSLTRDLVAPTGDFGFGEPREAHFKGVDGAQRVYPLTTN